jgi:indole-3-glycerol phosphate synthase
MGKDILADIVANKRIEVESQKRAVPLEELKSRVAGLPKVRSFKEALATSSTGIISEFKRRSPSKGWIAEGAQPEQVVPSYQAAGATALSILTDTNYFGGSMDDVIRVRQLTTLPILRKDFVVDEYQLYQAKLIGADAALLIAADLAKSECDHLTGVAHELGLEVLLEIHSESELEYITPETDVVGVNNRNLGSFHTDVANSFRLAELLPKDKVKVSESGLSKPETVKQLREAGFRGFLMGEAFMKTGAPGDALSEFINALKQ